jgi:recombinational DNA repair protein (RecF pathway)
VFTADGATVEIQLQRPRDLDGLSTAEVVVRAQALALSALRAAAASLA